MFFPLQFSTLNTSHHTPFLNVSIRPPSRFPCYFAAIKQNITVQFSVQMEPKWLCSWTTVALHCANTVYAPHRSLHDPSHVVQTQSPYYHQLCRTPIHWNSHSNTNPTTDSWKATFPSPCTSDTHHCTQHFNHPVPHTHITVLNIFLTQYLRHTSL